MDRLGRTRRQQIFLREAGIQDMSSLPEQKAQSEGPPKKERLQWKKQLKKLQTGDQVNLQLDSSKYDIEGNMGIFCEQQQVLPEKKQLKLKDVLFRLQLLKIFQGNHIEGCFGHATVHFTRPIIQGQYYIEMKICKSSITDSKMKIKYAPSLRVGLCPHGYSKTISLGQGLSIGYKSTTGDIICGSKITKGGQPFEEQDIIGVSYKFSPPDRYQSSDKIWVGSSVTFYKNGQEMARWQKIQQSYFCPAISLYNFAHIELYLKRQQMKFMPQGFRPYMQIYEQQIPYENLKSKKIFSNFVIQ